MLPCKSATIIYFFIWNISAYIFEIVFFCKFHVAKRSEQIYMILNMDKIQFESRAEIGTIIKALEDWQEDHGKKDETVQELINKLDAMSMNW